VCLFSLFAFDQEIWWFTAELVAGLLAIHGVNVVHRDMKPENIFVTKDLHLKIGFPFSCSILI
jgi:serine/threonine protein kinase